MRQILPRLADRRILTYGFSPQAELSAVDVQAQPRGRRFGVRLLREGRESLLGEIDLPMPGRHNVLNALAAVGVGLTLRIPFDTMARGDRRLPGRAPPLRVPGGLARRRR